MDAAAAQVSTVGCGGLCLVGHCPAGPAPWASLAAAGNADLLQQRDELRAVAMLSGGEDPGDRAAPAVGGQVNLGAQPATGAAQGLPARLPGGFLSFDGAPL